MNDNYKEGYNAFNLGIKRESNPRDIKGIDGNGPGESIHWWRGWDRAAWELGCNNQPKGRL